MSDELQKKMWEKVDSEEFAQIVLRQNYSLYSIDNWSRKEELEVNENPNPPAMLGRIE